MSSSPSSVLLLGMGPQSAGLIITLGFGTGGSPPTPSVSGYDAGDDRRYEEEFRKRDEEIRDARAKLRDDLLAAVQRVTGKPPSLDASPKQLAAIARKSESFDYRGTLELIAQLDAQSKALDADRKERTAEAKRKRRMRQEEEALLLLLLH